MPPKKPGVSESGRCPGQKEFNQAKLYEFIHQDYELAGRCYEKACKAGHAVAQYQYGLWFLDEAKSGVKRDEVKARKLFEASAAKGVGAAQFALGEMHENGKGGLKKCETKALELYKQSTQYSSTISKDILGRIYNKIGFMYMQGIGTLKDMNKALKWFRKAEGDASLPQNIKQLLESLAQINPGISRQKEADDRWSVMCDYIDKLPEEEKPKTFHAWVAVFKKCGYGVAEEYREKVKDIQCNFPEFMELAGGSFSTLPTYELQDYPAPRKKCGYCSQEEGDEVTLKLCSRCAQPYCSRTCQKKDWALHKPVCNTVYDNI